MMKTFNHVGNDLKDLKTENIEGKRYYVTPKGNKYVSITSLLGNLSKQSIIEWRRRVGETEANKISRQASSRGTRVHNICESYIQNQVGILEDALPDAIDMFKSIVPFLERIDNIHVVEAYRNYYINEKSRFAVWKSASQPDWYNEGVRNANV